MGSFLGVTSGGKSGNGCCGGVGAISGGRCMGGTSFGITGFSIVSDCYTFRSKNIVPVKPLL